MLPRKDVASKKRHIDLIAARENPMFLLHGLAALSDNDACESEGYRKGLQYVEDALGGL